MQIYKAGVKCVKYPNMIFFNKMDLKIKTKIHEIMKVQPSSF